jgi:hypothetical protein
MLRHVSNGHTSCRNGCDCQNQIVSFSAAEGRTQLLEDLAGATERIGAAIGALEQAYEQLDEHTAEELESELFRPAQAAYGRAQRTHAEFAKRSDLPRRAFPAPAPGLPQSAGEQLARAAEQLELADAALATLQDSLLPVEVGDRELRAGLAQVRTLIAPLPARARAMMRTVGR